MSSSQLRRGLACGVAALLIFAAAPLVPTQPTRADVPRYFAIKGARIVTVSGAPIDDGTVVIANGLIAAVGKDAAIPPEAWVIDGKGLTVYPGLIDAMTDLGLQGGAPAGPGGGQQPAAPAQQQQQQPARPPSQGPQDRPASMPWLNAADELRADDRRLENWRNAGFTTALSAPSRGIFPGRGAVISLGGERPGDMVIKPAATLQVTYQGAGGGFGGGFPNSLMGTLSYIKQVLLDAQHFEANNRVYEANPRANPRPGYDRTERSVAAALRNELPVLLPGNSAQQVMRSIALADEFKLRAVIYGGQQGYDVAATLAQKKYPVLVSLRWPEKAREADPDAEEDLSTLRFRDRAPGSPAALHKAGVKFAFYSDGITAPRDILKNAKKSIDAGLPADAALRAFTLGAAEILGVADRLGSIEAGKIANLVVTDGDIFNERTKIKMTFVDGQRFEAREPARPQERPTVNLTGRWNLTVTTPGGAQNATADLTMTEDGTLTGNVTSPVGSSAIREGWVSGNRFSFTVTFQQMGAMNFSGTMEGGQLKGSISVGGQSMEFTGTKPGGTDAAEIGGAQ